MFVHMLCRSAVSHPARSFTSVEMKGEGEKCFHMPKEAFHCTLCKNNKTSCVYVHHTPLFEPPRQKKSQSRRAKLHHSPHAKYISYGSFPGTKVQKFGSVRFFFKEINTFIQQGPIKLIKRDSKYIYNVTKDFKLCCSFELFVHQRILKKITTVFIIDNNEKSFLEQQISILELFLKDRDTEDWSNDAENSALITGIKYILQDIQIENTYLK